MALDITIDDDAVLEWRADLLTKAKQIVTDVLEPGDAFGERVIKTAKQIVRREAYETGSLMRSIDFDIQANRLGFRLEAGPTPDSRFKQPDDRDALVYAGFVNYGVRGRPPINFMLRAFQKHTGPRGKFMRDLIDVGVDI